MIVGLGNPGPDYEWTPHNLGFLAVDTLAGRAGIRITRPESKALVGLGKVAGQEVVLAKPQTMMNLSGVSVRMLLERYESGPADLLVLIDEADLPWGMLRIRDRGRNSTHNGLQSIISALGTDEFVRVRLGVQPEKLWGDRKEYVLRTMGREEREIAEEMAVEAADAVEMILTEGTEKAMSRFNRKATPEGADPE
ncbi:MAG: aminoacyl-tRNA hydrolase [Candidatus Acidoferrales bacterium]|nr:aminoacyl-tRNA hydrolase [Candidatus Acidoferrales bacterium]